MTELFPRLVKPLVAESLDHARIVDDGLWRLRARVADKAWFMRVGGGLLPEEFTLGQAQRLYEAIKERDWAREQQRLLWLRAPHPLTPM